jgi:hypothetical protein
MSRVGFDSFPSVRQDGCIDLARDFESDCQPNDLNQQKDRDSPGPPESGGLGKIDVITF